jgi:hypothetical protein
MKRTLAVAVLSFGLLAATAPGAHAFGCCGCGPGYFNFGINISGAWGHGAPPGSGGCCQSSPAMYNAAPYAAGWGFGPSPYDMAGYGAPYGYPAPYGHAGAPGYGAAPSYAGAPAYGAPNAAAGYGAQPAYSPTGYGAPAGYGY